MIYPADLEWKIELLGRKMKNKNVQTMQVKLEESKENTTDAHLT